MADIRSEILGKYGIDISQEDIFKLYKIEKVSTISEQELREKIEETRKRWNTSINGANERNAQRDRLRLEKADKYEAVLKDEKLREQVLTYYLKENRTKKTSGEDNGIAFAKEYFHLLSTAGKIRDSAYRFYFDYFKNERKNREAINAMLKKDFKFFPFEKKDAPEKVDEDEGEKKKSKQNSEVFIVNRFQEDTLRVIKKCVDFFQEASQNKELCQRYPALRESLFDLIGMKSIKDIQQFQKVMSEKRQEAYSFRQELGTQYNSLVDLFNNLEKLGKGYKDVENNFPEFKLLIQYPALTPYMFALHEVKPDTMKELITIAQRDCSFRDDTDFILNYYEPIYDNFGITNNGISSLIKKAKKKAGTNKVLNGLDEKLGRKKKRKISIGAEFIHWGMYFPLFAVYFVFEAFKVIFTKIYKLTVPIFLCLFIGENWLLPQIEEIDNLLVFGKIFSKTQWNIVLEEFFGSGANNWFELIVLSLTFIIAYLAIYILPPLFVSIFVGSTAKDLNSRYDWIGLERTFKNIFLKLRMKTEEQYLNQKELFFRNKIPKVIINVLCLIIIMILLVWFVPKFSGNFG